MRRNDKGRTKGELKMKFENILRAGALGTVLCAAAALSAQGNINVTVNGQPVAFENARPQMIGNRVLVPLRGVMEQLGAYVQWDPMSHTVTATRGGMDLTLRIGERAATVNGQAVNLDVPAMTIGGSTMVPLRFIGESLGADVRWDAANNSVLINTANAINNSQVNNYTPPNTTYQNPNQNQNYNSNNANSGAQTLRVNSFMHNATGWLKGGTPIHFTLDGTPGGQAVVNIPGVTGDIPMRETSAGHYEGDWMPTTSNGQPVTVRKALALARLTVNGQQQVVQAKSDLDVDTEAPVILDRYPTPDSTVATLRPQITVNFSDIGSGVSMDTVQMMFNGKNVTKQAVVTGNSITYTPMYDLAPGRYDVYARMFDNAGNTASSRWSFNVAGSSVNTLFSHTGTGNLAPGRVIDFDLRAEPGSRVSVNIGNRVNLPLTETGAGIYHGTYTVRNTDAFENDLVTASIVAPNGQTYTLQSPQRFGSASLMSPSATAPVIASPAPSDMATDPLVIRGSAPPNSTVQIHVDYATSVMGALRVNGALADVTTTTDAYGHFETRPISLNTFMKGTNTVYTVTATTLLPNGNKSNVTTMTLRQ
jgi:hypothetical protein